VIYQCTRRKCQKVWALFPTAKLVKGRVSKRVCPDCADLPPEDDEQDD